MVSLYQLCSADGAILGYCLPSARALGAARRAHPDYATIYRVEVREAGKPARAVGLALAAMCGATPDIVRVGQIILPSEIPIP